ncbi:hypothetical protein APASM_1131 [Actinosynnema pretiosum subsp. pretiosum]|nr:hypothetical protein APASM_1131 [Actinosynnema pretiosum subsp. pretiosum]
MLRGLPVRGELGYAHRPGSYVTSGGELPELITLSEPPRHHAEAASCA